MKQKSTLGRKYWIAVASKEHVMLGVQEEFAQICHGRVSPLQAMQPGDKIIYYSPTRIYGEKKPYQKFTALGTIQQGSAYQDAELGEKAQWRRHTKYVPIKDVAAKDLVPFLSCITHKKYWGMPFRRGIFSISEDDFILIAGHMELDMQSL